MTDQLLMNFAKQAYNDFCERKATGQPATNEAWMRMVCEAHGVDHGFADSHIGILTDLENDVKATHDALKNVTKIEDPRNPRSATRKTAIDAAITSLELALG